MNQQPQSTIYTVPEKTKDGRTFNDLYPELIAPFPPEAHKERVIGRDRQGKTTYWVYLPWQAIRDRLIQVVGVQGFIFETTGYWLDESGNPVIQVRLNILGVVKEALGFHTAHEKFQGNKSQVTLADAYKNAAEEFGIGAYIDDQPFVIRYLWQNATDQETKLIAQKLAGQHGLKLKRLRQEVVTGNVASDNLIDQTNLELKRLGWSNSQGREFLEKCYGKRSRSQLSETELADFLNRLKATNSATNSI